MKDRNSKKLDEIIRLMERDDSVDAPASSVRWAKNLYRSRQAQPSLIKRIVASLQADLTPGKAAFGERSATGAATRQMLFNAGRNAVDLRVTTGAAKVDINGQLLGEGFAGGRLTVSAGRSELTAAIDELGQFSIKGVPKGLYKFTFTGSGPEIVIEEVDI
jgi:hypothetical protein